MLVHNPDIPGIYQIMVTGGWEASMKEHFKPVAVREMGSYTILTRLLPDQSALLQFLVRLRSLDLMLVSFKLIPGTFYDEPGCD